MKTILSLVLMAGAAMAQTTSNSITIPNVVIYQTAVAAGVDYVAPPAGNAILSEKVSTNWKTVGLKILGEGSLATLTGGLTGVFSLSAGVLKGLAVAHTIYDLEVQPILSSAAPSGLANVSPVLPMAGSVTVSSTSGAEYTIFAASVGGVNGKIKNASLKPISTNVNGVQITFAPQGVTVMKNAAGSKVPQLMIVDVLISPLAAQPTVLKSENEIPDKELKVRPAMLEINTTPMVSYPVEYSPVAVNDLPLPIQASKSFDESSERAFIGSSDWANVVTASPYQIQVHPLPGPTLQLLATNSEEQAESMLQKLGASHFAAIAIPAQDKPGIIRVMVVVTTGSVNNTIQALNHAGFDGTHALLRKA